MVEYYFFKYMLSIRIYCASFLQSNTQITLTDETVHYLRNVLRSKPGESIKIFNGQNGEFLAVIAAIDHKKVIIDIQQSIGNITESPLFVHLGQAISKGERMDYAIQKAVELGVSEITPILTERCNVKFDREREKKRILHWQKIVINACEQCGRVQIPKVNPVIDWKVWLKSQIMFSIICAPDSPRQDFLKNTISPPKTIRLLIGPEGGFSPLELKHATELFQCKLLSLGPRVLRTETATVVALSLLQYFWGDFSFSPRPQGGR